MVEGIEHQLGLFTIPKPPSVKHHYSYTFQFPQKPCLRSLVYQKSLLQMNYSSPTVSPYPRPTTHNLCPIHDLSYSALSFIYFPTIRLSHWQLGFMVFTNISALFTCLVSKQLVPDEEKGIDLRRSFNQVIYQIRKPRPREWVGLAQAHTTIWS